MTAKLSMHAISAPVFTRMLNNLVVDSQQG